MEVRFVICCCSVCSQATPETSGNSLIYVIAHDLVVRRMGNAILLKNPNPVDSALFCWLVLSAIWTNGPKAVTSRRSAYVSGSPVLLLWKLLRNKIPQISDKSVQAPRDSFQSIAEWKLDKTFLYYFLCMTVERVLKLLVQISYLFFFPGVRATRVRMLRKEIALVRRKLNQEKRHLSESSGLWFSYLLFIRWRRASFLSSTIILF